MIGPNFEELGDWIYKNMPELWLMDVDESRKQLNSLTGLDVKSTDEIEASSGRYLEALKKMHKDDV